MTGCLKSRHGKYRPQNLRLEGKSFEKADKVAKKPFFYPLQAASRIHAGHYRCQESARLGVFQANLIAQSAILLGFSPNGD